MKWLIDFIQRNRTESTEADKWILSNAEDSRDADPRNFSIPRLEQRQGRQPFDIVCVQFISTQRLPKNYKIADFAWVEIKKSDGKFYQGLIQKGLRVITQLEGTEVTFGPEHIFGIKLPPVYILPAQLQVKMSAEVWLHDKWPNVLLRTTPESEEDSGWRIFSDNQESSTASISEKCLDVLQKFPVLESVLDEPSIQMW